MFRDTPRIGAVHFFLWEGKKPKRRKTGNYILGSGAWDPTWPIFQLSHPS